MRPRRLHGCSDEIADLRQALAILHQCREDARHDGMMPGLNAYAAGRLERAAAHLERQVVGYFGDRRPITTEQAAMTVLRALADELQAAGLALDIAAKALKAAGAGYRAEVAHKASRRALDAADQVHA
jgi:hypothetical protein